jgi:hypothetical protein
MTRHVIHVGGSIIDRAGGHYTVAQCKTMVMVAQQLADCAGVGC